MSVLVQPSLARRDRQQEGVPAPVHVVRAALARWEDAGHFRYVCRQWETDFYMTSKLESNSAGFKLNSSSSAMLQLPRGNPGHMEGEQALPLCRGLCCASELTAKRKVLKWVLKMSELTAETQAWLSCLKEQFCPLMFLCLIAEDCAARTAQAPTVRNI